MYKAIVVLAIVALFAACASAEVAKLDDSNFKSFVSENPISIIKFYAPWCGHCKKLAPTWEEFGNADNAFKVASVDCTVAKDTCSAEGIRGYPTVKVFVDGQSSPHQGARTIEAFTASVKAAAGGRI